MPKNICEFRIKIGETRALIKTDSIKAANSAINSIRYNRSELERYILKNPDFFKALKPIDIIQKSPEIIKRMTSASKSAGVGPMAAVAGAISDLAVDAMVEEDAKIAVVENGGEISANSETELNIGIISGSPSISGRFGLKIRPDEMPLGICTTSATLSHALTFGEADAVTILAENAALGDAASTSICNEVKGKDVKKSIEKSLKLAKKIKGVLGAIIIQNGFIGTVGEIPQIISIEGLEDSHMITINNF
jgi:ApbE superfamily uncharacterized protein (UPF0280 family)